MHRKRNGLLCVVLLWFCGAALAQVNDAPVEVRAAHEPSVFRGSDDRNHLAYELHVTNFYKDTGSLRLRKLSVFGLSSDRPIATFEGEAIGKLLSKTNEDGTPLSEVVIPAEKRVVLFVWLTAAEREAFPGTLHHRFEFSDEKGKTYLAEGVPVVVSNSVPLRIGAPLRQHLWMVNEGPGNARSHHWGSMVAVNGVITIPQRFAIDFVGLNPSGHAVEVAPEKLRETANADWTGFGSDVLAVADGTVRDVRDGIEDNKPLSPQQEPESLTARGLYGNFVVLEIAPGVFAHYAHLERGSIAKRLIVGAKVRKGEVLARVGDSGSSGAPHLHFQVTNKPVFEESEGLPFAIEHFAVVGKTDEGAILNSTSKLEQHPVSKQAELPLSGEVIAFDLH